MMIKKCIDINYYFLAVDPSDIRMTFCVCVLLLSRYSEMNSKMHFRDNVTSIRTRVLYFRLIQTQHELRCRPWSSRKLCKIAQIAREINYRQDSYNVMYMYMAPYSCRILVQIQYSMHATRVFQGRSPVAVNFESLIRHLRSERFHSSGCRG